MCCVFLITNVLSHFFFFYLNQKVSLICKDFSWFSVCKTQFFSTCELVFFEPACRLHTHRIEQNNAVQEETRCARMDRHSHRPVTCLQETKPCLETYTVRLYIIAWKDLFFSWNIFHSLVFSSFSYCTHFLRHMIPAATENECRIWYTCVIYLKVTKVCGET